MCAGAYQHFMRFVGGKLTNATRMWRSMLSGTRALRHSLLYEFKTEEHLLTPLAHVELPIEIENWNEAMTEWNWGGN